MHVLDIMTKNVVVVDPWMSILEASKKMRDGDLGCLLVGENDRLIGAITDRDIVTRGLAEARNSATTPVRSVMSPGIMYCYEDQTVEEAARSMARNKIRRLAVLNREKRLVGVLSLGDIALAREDADQAASALSKISEHNPENATLHA